MVMVSRDHKGNLIEAWTKQISLGSSIRGEAEATWCAICRATAKGFQNNYRRRCMKCDKTSAKIRLIPSLEHQSYI